LSILPEYLRNAATDAGTVVDFRDWQIPLGRRFRALKLWFVLRWYGAEGLRAHIRSHVALAQELAGWADADERFDVAAPHPLSLVCLRPRWADGVDADVATMTLLERLNDSGEVFLTHTAVGGQVVLRVAIGAPSTTRAHVERVWTLLKENHDWLAADFAAAAEEHEAARVAQQERAEQEATRAAEQERTKREGAEQEATRVAEQVRTEEQPAQPESPAPPHPEDEPTPAEA
jgi:aromatic-L-amino-acid decarboxylase